MTISIYESIYNKLEALGITDLYREKTIEAHKSKSGGYMDLNYDYLGIRTNDPREPAPCYDIALSHYYKENGDMMADPDMEIRIYPAIRSAKALTFQMANPPIYQEVYPEPGRYIKQLRTDLNIFLNQWLQNCIDQGHTFKAEQAEFVH